jgi:cytochrome b561
MAWRDSAQGYGIVTRLLHWLSALAVIGLFAVGLWMDGMTYYDPWYQRAPALHKSFGVLLTAVILLRLLWRWRQPRPEPLPTHGPWTVRLSRGAQILMYVLVLAMFPSGYLISTAKGDGLEVFGLFEIPALVTGIDRLEDTAGQVHEILAYSLIGIASVHALAALKHHFVDRDTTLRRMLTSRQ